MKSKSLVLMFLFLLASSGASHYAQAEGCRTAVTVTRSTSGTFSSVASLRSIAETLVHRLTKQWEAASKKAYGERFSNLSRGTCECKVLKNARIGEKVSIRCQLTARPCDYNYGFLEDFKCNFS